MKLTATKLKQMIQEEVTEINENLKRLFGKNIHKLPDGIKGDEMLIQKAEELAGTPGDDASLVFRIITNRMKKIGAKSDPNLKSNPYGYDQGPALDRIAKLKKATHLLDPDLERTAAARPGRKDMALNPEKYDHHRLTTTQILIKHGQKE